MLDLIHLAKFNKLIITFGKSNLASLAWPEALTRHPLHSALMERLNHLGPVMCHPLHSAGPNVWIITAGVTNIMGS